MTNTANTATLNFNRIDPEILEARLDNGSRYMVITARTRGPRGGNYTHHYRLTFPRAYRTPRDFRTQTEAIAAANDDFYASAIKGRA